MVLIKYSGKVFTKMILFSLAYLTPIKLSFCISTGDREKERERKREKKREKERKREKKRDRENFSSKKKKKKKKNWSETTLQSSK